MNAEARAVLEQMAEALEGISFRPKPLSDHDIFAAWVNIVAATTVLRQLDSSDKSDAVVDRLIVAIEQIDTIGGIA